MPRKKKTETFDVSKELEKKLKEKPIDYGTGWARKNNMIQAGVKEDERNE